VAIFIGKLPLVVALPHSRVEVCVSDRASAQGLFFSLFAGVLTGPYPASRQAFNMAVSSSNAPFPATRRAFSLSTAFRRRSAISSCVWRTLPFSRAAAPGLQGRTSAPRDRQDDATAGIDPDAYSRAILNRLLIDLSWASSHLEGNTYSHLDTRELIEHGKAARGKAAIETQMILNHKTAIELLVENISEAEFNRYTLMNLHSALAENLLPNPADEGRVRLHAVDIGKSVYRPLSTPPQIEDALDALLDKVNQISDPFEQSFFMMVHLPYLQPFADINKRTSRLAANLLLFRANLCPLTFLDAPKQAYGRATLGVYELTRVELLRDLYVWAYERSTQEYLALKQNLAEPAPCAWPGVT
jgi:fido (protein-threonine AMPylation protein)